MIDVPNPVYITSYYPSLPDDPASDPSMAVTATTPLWQDITLRNVKATGSTNAGILRGLPETKISGVVFADVQIEARTGWRSFTRPACRFKMARRWRRSRGRRDDVRRGRQRHRHDCSTGPLVGAITGPQRRPAPLA